MNLKLKRTYILVFVITIVIIIIAIAIPMVIYSNSYSKITGIAAWTPVFTETPTQTLDVSSTITPHQEPSLTISPSTVTNSNCVYPIEYWREHPEYWLNMLVGDTMYSGDDFRQILENQSQAVHENLLKQLYLANLNIFSGADPSIIEDALIEVYDWFQTYSPEEQLTEEGRQVGIQLTQILLDFNNGLVEPGFCQGYKASLLSQDPTTLPDTALPTSTSTATRYWVTLRPSATATKKHGNEPTQTAPPQPTNEPITNTPKPQPTSTIPPQPTEEPTSAPPEDTPIPTDPPEPTDPPDKPTPTPVP